MLTDTKKLEAANKPAKILINQISEVIGVKNVNYRYIKCFFLTSTSVTDPVSQSRSWLNQGTT